MRLITVDTGSGTRAAVQVGEAFALVPGEFQDVGALLRAGDAGLETARRAEADADDSLNGVILRRPVLNPDAVICVGLNYRTHIEEMGRELPTAPTLFTKLGRALTDPYADVQIPAVTRKMDYEGELAVVIGKRGRFIARDQAWDYVAGVSVLNDVTARDHQNRTLQWWAGKSFEATTPMGPAVVTLDEVGDVGALELRLTVNGEGRQRTLLDDLVFDVPALIEDISQIVSLEPGDVISTGSPGGVGMASETFLGDGDVVEVTIDRIGSIRNVFRGTELMIDGVFVFDNAIHCYDMSEENLRDDRHDAAHAHDLLLAGGDGGRFAGFNDGSIEFERKWTIEDLYELVFDHSPTDLAMAQTVPLFDWYRDSWAPVLTQHAMAERYPDRVMFCGGVDPLHHGIDGALDQLDWQIKELGARSIKFYNAHVDKSWACDDREVAYPLYERCQELGVKVLQFHKGIPFGLMNVEDLRPNDLQRPARDFPDLSFVIHHLAVPYFDEAVSIAGRFPNVYLSLAANLNFILIAPRVVQKQVGQLLQMVGSEKLCYASDAPFSGGPAPYLRAFMDMEIPEDLCDGYGYPQITRQDRENILGLTFARLMGVDVEATKQKLAAT